MLDKAREQHVKKLKNWKKKRKMPELSEKET